MMRPQSHNCKMEHKNFSLLKMVINNPQQASLSPQPSCGRESGGGEIYLMRLITKMVRPDELNDFSDKERAAEQRPIRIIFMGGQILPLTKVSIISTEFFY